MDWIRSPRPSKAIGVCDVQYTTGAPLRSFKIVSGLEIVHGPDATDPLSPYLASHASTYGAPSPETYGIPRPLTHDAHPSTPYCVSLSTS